MHIYCNYYDIDVKEHLDFENLWSETRRMYPD